MTNLSKGVAPEAGDAQKGKDEAPGQNKTVSIVVNAKPKEFTGKKISFEEVVKLAYGTFEGKPVVYTVTYTRGENHHSGEMDEGDSVPVKEGMEFTVTKDKES
jgi:hypothetical protein